jgi:hypothetical protein
MKSTTGLLLVLTLSSMPAMAQKITTDFARDFDFTSIETYTVNGIPSEDPSDQLTDDRTRHAIIRELHRGGLLTTSSNPDLRIEYRLMPNEESKNGLTSANPGPDWTGWNGSSPTPTTTLPGGTLVIVATDTASGKLVWRATGTVKSKKKPDAMHTMIDKIIAKQGKRWRLILDGQGK